MIARPSSIELASRTAGQNHTGFVRRTRIVNHDQGIICKLVAAYQGIVIHLDFLPDIGIIFGSDTVVTRKISQERNRLRFFIDDRRKRLRVVIRCAARTRTASGEHNHTHRKERTAENFFHIYLIVGGEQPKKKITKSVIFQSKSIFFCLQYRGRTFIF